MKHTFLMTALLMAMFAPKSVWAGVEKFNSDEFNAIIQENLQAEQDLHNQLRQNAGVPDLRKEMNPHMTTDHKVQKTDKTDKRLMDRNLKRLSQEIQTIDGK